MDLFNWVNDPQAWAALGSLVILEIILGIDNIVFVSIIIGRLPKEQRLKARRQWLTISFCIRVALLMGISWILKLKEPLFTIGEFHPTGKDLILLGGGVFLVYKSVMEIYNKLEGEEHHANINAAAQFAKVMVQIVLVDMVFSFDSVLTAVGMAKDIGVMITAVIIALAFILVYSGPVSDFVEKHPSVKILALSFLILIGVNLVGEAFHHAIPKGYTYSMMGFAFLVELLNLRYKKKAAKAVQLHNSPSMAAVEAEANAENSNIGKD